MSQFGVPDQTMVVERKTSGLAVASLISSLIFCCPVTTILGVLLGLGAMISIGGNPARKGKGLAAAGILIGIIATIGQGWGGYLLYETFYKPVLVGPAEALSAGASGDLAGFRAATTGSANAASDEEITAFFAELQTRYGPYQRVTFDQNSQPPQTFGQPKCPFGYIVDFQNTTVNAEVEMTFADEVSGQMVMKWSAFTFYDDELGDLTLPAKTEDGG